MQACGVQSPALSVAASIICCLTETWISMPWRISIIHKTELARRSAGIRAPCAWYCSEWQQQQPTQNIARISTRYPVFKIGPVSLRWARHKAVPLECDRLMQRRRLLAMEGAAARYGAGVQAAPMLEPAAFAAAQAKAREGGARWECQRLELEQALARLRETHAQHPWTRFPAQI